MPPGAGTRSSATTTSGSRVSGGTRTTAISGSFVALALLSAGLVSAQEPTGDIVVTESGAGTFEIEHHGYQKLPAALLASVVESAANGTGP